MATDNEEQIFDGIDALETWKSLEGEKVAPYLTEAVVEQNVRTLTEFGVANIPGGLFASAQVGFWEISFARCLEAGTLTRDPDWQSRAGRNAVLQKEFDSLPAAESRQRYLNDPEFRRFVDSIQGGL